VLRGKDAPPSNKNNIQQDLEVIFMLLEKNETTNLKED
jgi:hypothetical protein